MTTRILSTLTALAVAALAVVSLGHSAPASAAKRKCSDKARGVTVLARTKTAVVFERKARSGPAKGFPIAFACIYKRGANVLLGEDTSESPIQEPTLAGSYVAFGYGDCFGTEGQCGIAVKVVDIRTGKKVREGASFVGGSDDSVTDIVLTPKGYAAWVATSDDDDFNSLGQQVHALDSAGRRLLDSGGTIRNLKLTGATLSWTNAGVPKTATLG
jgi:hypothetical protein